MNSGHVLYTKNPEAEIAEIEKLDPNKFRKVYYIYHKRAGSVDHIISKYSFRMIPLEDVLDPSNIDLFADNCQDDLIILKCPTLSNIMDRRIDKIQIELKGYKFVVDDHPYMGKRDLYWFYFPYSYFDKALLMYPHCFAFRDARPTNDFNPFDTTYLAERVVEATRITYKYFYPEINTISFSLSGTEHEQYKKLKEKLFITEKTYLTIVRKLRDFVIGTKSARKAADGCADTILDMKCDVNGLYNTFRQGLEGPNKILVSDAKVDQYLLKMMTSHINETNSLTSNLWRLTHGQNISK